MTITRYAALYSRALSGMDSPEIQVEVHASNGLPSLAIVGLPEASVKESKDRVRSALLSAGFQLSPKRITVNLAPADVPKTGSRYDLPIALAILVATDQLVLQRKLEDFEFVGELGLNGEIRSVQGVVVSALKIRESSRELVCPLDNLSEAGLVKNAKVLGVRHLLEVCHFLSDLKIHLPKAIFNTKPPLSYEEDISDIRGQLQAKRLLEVCASGRHSLLMVGSPGSGKSMLANRLVTLLPRLTDDEAIEVAALHSLAGSSVSLQSLHHRKTYTPHHTSTTAAIVGGGSGNQVKPGIISLAHKSVLFLDELPEFSRQVLESLREPLEAKKVEIVRVNQKVSFLADPQLICAMNPTPSGFFADDVKDRCKDTPEQIARYLNKISGPLLDRIDCHLEVPPVKFEDLRRGGDPLAETSETSEIVRNRVEICQTMQRERQGCLNSELSVKKLAVHAELSNDSENLLKQAVEKIGLSARSYHRVLRVARTLADMEKEKKIQISQVAEALGYRSLDRRLKP